MTATFDDASWLGLFDGPQLVFDGESPGPPLKNDRDDDVFLGRVLGPDDGRMGRHP